VARTGEIYVADTMNYRVQKFAALSPSGPNVAANQRK
jgi:hypothetical protein